jgi:hypothetical protein
MSKLQLQAGRCVRYYARSGSHVYLGKGRLLVSEAASWLDSMELPKNSLLTQDEALAIHKNGWITLIAQTDCDISFQLQPAAALDFAQARSVLRSLLQVLSRKFA